MASLAIPESPRWLLLAGGDANRDRALAVLARMEPGATPEELRETAARIVAGTAADGDAG